MKILFENVLKDSTVSSVDGSANYPATNLLSRFLRKIYRSTAANFDTITITLDEYKYISSFFIGYTDSVKIVLRLYNGATLLNTHTFEETDTDERITVSGETRETTSGAVRVVSENLSYTAAHFDSSYYVSHIELDVYGGTNIFIGGVGAGQAWEAAGPVATWDEPFIDSSVVTISPFGQVLQNEGRALSTYLWTFRELTRDQANALQDIYRSVKIGAMVWVDAFEDNHDFKKPFYATLAEPIETRKNGRRYDVLISLQEAG